MSHSGRLSLDLFDRKRSNASSNEFRQEGDLGIKLSEKAAAESRDNRGRVGVPRPLCRCQGFASVHRARIKASGPALHLSIGSCLS